MDSRKNKDKKLKGKGLSKELHDKPVMHDEMFNSVPGACFEIGSSLILLDNPGEAGKLMDSYAKKVAEIIALVYKDEQFKNIEVQFDLSLKAYFDKKILVELQPSSDQIGRCLDMNKDKNWLNGEGVDWILEQLYQPSDTSNYTNMLTKIRTISAFGTILREQMKNKLLIALLLDKPEKIVEERNSQIISQVRHEKFDDPYTRARTEKNPIVGGKVLKRKGGQVEVELTEASLKGLGFGKVYHVDEMKARNDEGKKIIQTYKEMESKAGRRGMKRQGQDIIDPEKPGLIGESGLKMIPDAFINAGLDQALNHHKFSHGSGVNRWRLHGSYAKQSWDHDFPAAGVHSGGTSDILLACNCLDENSIFGDKKTESLGLLISSFMNFGGYHSFIETFPIAQTVANDSKFKVQVTKDQKNLYSDILNVSKKFSPEASKDIKKYLSAYEESLREMHIYKSKEIKNSQKGKDDINVKYSSEGKLASDIPLPDKNALAKSNISIDNPEKLVRSLSKVGVFSQKDKKGNKAETKNVKLELGHKLERKIEHKIKHKK